MLGIHKGLVLLYDTVDDQRAWLMRPDPTLPFSGQCPIDLMTNGEAGLVAIVGGEQAGGGNGDSACCQEDDQKPVPGEGRKDTQALELADQGFDEEGPELAIRDQNAIN